MRALSLGYHEVTDTCELPPHKMIYLIEKGRFKSHLASIKAKSADGLVQTIDSLRDWAGTVPLFLTFDDGTLSSYTVVADQLESFGWRGHFFIITDRIGQPGYLDRRQIRELALRGHVIGSHTCSHPERMNILKWSELLREWSESRAILSDLLGRSVDVASVANGFYSVAVGRAAMESGIQVLFTSTPTARVHPLDGGLVLGRFSVQRHTTDETMGAFAALSMMPRLQQAASWYTKAAVKTLTGEHYFRFRRSIISLTRPGTA
jgi:peptidoglycan/xylan/chitin deacetylase (PgdA/CDA1 family)